MVRKVKYIYADAHVYYSEDLRVIKNQRYQTRLNFSQTSDDANQSPAKMKFHLYQNLLKTLTTHQSVTSTG